MPVAFDASILLPLLTPLIPTTLDEATGKPIGAVEERINFLLTELERTRTKVIVPTPALSEILVHAGDAGPEYLNRLKQSSAFAIKPFDDVAAVEVALMIRDAIKSGDKRGGIDDSWAKVKFDRQIVAIAKVNGASVIYSDDRSLQAFATQAGLIAIGIADLPLPPPIAPTQLNMFQESTNPQAGFTSISQPALASDEELPSTEPARSEEVVVATKEEKEKG